VDLETLEAVDALELNSLLKSNAKLLRDTLNLDVGIALDSQPKSLVEEQPGVESSVRIHVSDLDVLVDLDDLLLLRSGLGEVDAGEGRMGLEVLKVHDAGEGGNGGVGLAVSADGGVDGHVVGVGFGLGDDDGVECELGIVKFLLGDVGNSNEDAGGGKQPHVSESVHSW
jgi:hypothetical protein